MIILECTIFKCIFGRSNHIARILLKISISNCLRTKKFKPQNDFSIEFEFDGWQIIFVENALR